MQTKTLHFRAVSISRHKAQPDNAVKACAYRSGQNLYDEKERRSHYYGNRGGVVEIGLFAPVAAPEWMRDADQRRLWQRFGNEIEKVEDGHNRRASAQLAKDFQVAAPRELTHEQNWALAQAFAGKLNDRGLAVAVGFHEEEASDGLKNPHFHFLVPMRGVNEDGFGKKYRALDGKPGGKNPEFKKLRQEYFQCVNDALADAGVTGLYYDPEKQDHEPGIHKGKAASALEKKGQDSYIGAHNRKVGYDNIMRPYDQALENAPGGWAWGPPTVAKNRNAKVAELQMRRGSAMAARDATQKSQSNVSTPPATRSQSRTEMAREQAKLSIQQNRTWQERTQNRSQEKEPGR